MGCAKSLVKMKRAARDGLEGNRMDSEVDDEDEDEDGKSHIKGFRSSGGLFIFFLRSVLSTHRLSRFHLYVRHFLDASKSQEERSFYQFSALGYMFRYNGDVVLLTLFRIAHKQ